MKIRVTLAWIILLPSLSSELASRHSRKRFRETEARQITMRRRDLLLYFFTFLIYGLITRVHAAGTCPSGSGLVNGVCTQCGPGTFQDADHVNTTHTCEMYAGFLNHTRRFFSLRMTAASL